MMAITWKYVTHYTFTTKITINTPLILWNSPRKNQFQTMWSVFSISPTVKPNESKNTCRKKKIVGWPARTNLISRFFSENLLYRLTQILVERDFFRSCMENPITNPFAMKLHKRLFSLKYMKNIILSFVAGCSENFLGVKFFNLSE